MTELHIKVIEPVAGVIMVCIAEKMAVLDMRLTIADDAQCPKAIKDHMQQEKSLLKNAWDQVIKAMNGDKQDRIVTLN